MHSFLSSEPPASIKNQNANKRMPYVQKTSSKRDIMETIGLPNKLPNVEVSHLKSTKNEKQETIVKQENPVCNNVTSTERLKTPIKTKVTNSSSNDKSVQFCTPKHSKMTSTLGANTKFNILPSSRTPIKRYFSDHALTQSTPDCFNTVHLETPHKTDDIAAGEQTIYEGESSNLTVGIRIRPLNSK